MRKSISDWFLGEIQDYGSTLSKEHTMPSLCNNRKKPRTNVTTGTTAQLYRKVENRTGNRLTEPVFKTARKPETNHKPNRTEQKPNRPQVCRGSNKATNPHFWPLLVLIFASAVLATHETPLKFGKQKTTAHERSVILFARLWRRQHRQQHRHGIPFQSGSKRN